MARTGRIGNLLKRVPFIQTLLAHAVTRVLTRPKRQRLFTTPLEHGMGFESIEFFTDDGIAINGWIVAAQEPKGLVIVNHPFLCTRAGSKQGLNDVSVDFLPTIRHLHNANYTVLTYDHRGHGESGGGVGRQRKGVASQVGLGCLEWQDFIAAVDYVNDNPTLNQLPIGFLTQCMGANASLEAWRKHSEKFDLERVKCQVLVQPTIAQNLTSRLTTQILKTDLTTAIGTRLNKLGLTYIDASNNIQALQVPAMFVQVRDDRYTVDADTGINDIETIVDGCPTEKTLVWVGPNETVPYGSGQRFDGHNYFNEHPQELIAFLDSHIDS